VRLLRFSGAVLTLQFGVYTANQCDTLLLGLFFGPVAAGVYRLADRLMRMLLEVATRSVQSVALPHFARLQDDPAALRAAVESCIRLSATVAIPAMAVLAAVSEPFFSIMGEQWSASGSVLNVLVIMGVAKAITLFTGPLLLANGKPMVPAILTWTLGVITVGGITAIGIMAAHWPFDAQIISVAIVRTLIFVLLYGTASVVLTRRACGLPFNRFIRAAIPGLGAGSAAVSIGFLLEASGLLGHLPPVMRLVVQSTSSMVAALTTIVATDRNIRRYLVTRIVELTGDRIPVRPRSMHCPTE
jgi:PST family polysaccharide transporter